MNDLISRKALNEAISYALYSSIRLDVSDIRNIINSQPTAYDVDKVVEQIERERVNAFLTLANTGDSKYDFAWKKVSRYLDITEEIIKGGGVE